MKKLPKKPNLTVPKVPKLPPIPGRRVKSAEQKVSDALATVPKITNETLGEHREEVLRGARKYIYPLKHSQHRVVRTSIGLFIAVLVVFFAISGLELYKFQTTSGFFYDVVSVIPLPVAKAGTHYVSYESYLFELRSDMHYYQSQQQATFAGKDGKAQLQQLKQEAMNQAVQNSYVSQLAKTNNVKVSNVAINNEITELKDENRLGSSQQSLQSTLSSYFGWSVSDFRRKIGQELLAQAVVAKLDTATNARSQAALQALQKGADFSTLAGQVSDDATTKTNGGQYPFAVTLNSSNVSPAITAAAFKLKPGQVSSIINTGFTLDIIKVIDATAGSEHIAHIQFTFQPISTYVNPLQKAHPSHSYIKI